MVSSMMRRMAVLGLALRGFPARRAQAQKKLVVYTSNESTLNELVFAAFTKETGIEVEPVAAGSGVVIRRLQAEKERPLGDIIWGVSRSLLQTNKALFDALRLEEQGRHAGRVSRPRRSVDRQQPAPAGDPAEHQDRCRPTRGRRPGPTCSIPKWKGKIAFTDPANSGSAYSDGHDAGRPVGRRRRRLEEGRRRCSATLKVLNRSSLVFQGVGNGEYPLGISLEYAGPMWAAGGAPVKVIYPADGTIAAMEGVAIIKGGPNPESAKAFVDYVNRKDVREMILKATFRRPTRSDLDLVEAAGRACRRCRRVKLAQLRRGRLDGRSAGKTLEQIKDVLQETR